MAYHYFGNKDSLYQAALGHVYEQFLNVDVSLAEMLLSPEQLLTNLVAAYYDFLNDNPQFVRLLCFENLNQGRAVRQLNLKNTKTPIITALRLALDKGQSQECFRKDIDIEQLLVSIFGLCFFYFSNRFTLSELFGHSTITKARLAARKKHVVSLLLHSLAV